MIGWWVVWKRFASVRTNICLTVQQSFIICRVLVRGCVLSTRPPVIPPVSFSLVWVATYVSAKPYIVFDVPFYVVCRVEANRSFYLGEFVISISQLKKRCRCQMTQIQSDGVTTRKVWFFCPKRINYYLLYNLMLFYNLAFVEHRF